MCGHNQKRGVLGTSTTRKRGNEVAQKGVLGAYLYIIFTFTSQYDQLVGVCSGRLKRGGGLSLVRAQQEKGGGGLRCGSNSKQGGS